MQSNASIENITALLEQAQRDAPTLLLATPDELWRVKAIAEDLANTFEHLYNTHPQNLETAD